MKVIGSRRKSIDLFVVGPVIQFLFDFLVVAGGFEMLVFGSLGAVVFGFLVPVVSVSLGVFRFSVGGVLVFGLGGVISSVGVVVFLLVQ